MRRVRPAVGANTVPWRLSAAIVTDITGGYGAIGQSARHRGPTVLALGGRAFPSHRTFHHENDAHDHLDIGRQIVTHGVTIAAMRSFL